MWGWPPEGTRAEPNAVSVEFLAFGLEHLHEDLNPGASLQAQLVLTEAQFVQLDFPIIVLVAARLVVLEVGVESSVGVGCNALSFSLGSRSLQGFV